MRKKLLLSVSSLIAVLAIGVTATYALISSNTATISASEIDTGNASIKLCSRVDNKWANNIAGFKLTGLLPGDTDKDLTNNTNIFVGNDNGGLNNLDSCTYGTDPASTSTVNMKLVPVVTVTNGGTDACTTQAESDIQLKFQVGNTDSGYGTLASWAKNTTQYGDVINVDNTAQLQIFAKMSQTSTQKGQSCQFNVSLTGVQQ